jgi:predicted CXXCH cytochrome family protein
MRCHSPHFSKQPTLLTNTMQSLCAECHDVKTDAFAQAHLDINPAVMTCTNCHAPHASNDPKLFKSEQHAPFAGRSCEECHVVRKR